MQKSPNLADNIIPPLPHRPRPPLFRLLGKNLPEIQLPTTSDKIDICDLDPRPPVTGEELVTDVEEDDDGSGEVSLEESLSIW